LFAAVYEVNREQCAFALYWLVAVFQSDVNWWHIENATTSAELVLPPDAISRNYVFGISVQMIGGYDSGIVWRRCTYAMTSSKYLLLFYILSLYHLSLQTAQLRLCVRVIHVDDSHIPKQSFCGQLLRGCRHRGRQYKRYEDSLKDTLKQCDITPSRLETLASDRTDWRSMCKSAVRDFKARRGHELEAKWDLQKFDPPCTGNCQCQIG